MTEITETHRLPFGRCGSEQQPIFSVNPGIALEDALTQLSHLLTCAQATASEMCDARALDRGLVGATVHCIEGAKALVDSLLIRS